MTDLSAEGLIRKDGGSSLGWRVNSQCFSWWIKDEIIAGTRDEEDFEKSLKQREYGNVFTNEQTDKSVFNAVPASLISGSGDFIAKVLKEVCQ